MDDRFEWDRLRVFRLIADLGSMSSTAARIGTSVPTISRRITELEADLRVELVSRSTTGVELTPAGRVLLRHANVMADAVCAIGQDLADADTSLAGPLRLAAGDALGTYWIAPRLSDFRAAHPGIDLTLAIRDTTPSLADNEADISIQFQRPVQPDVVARRMGAVHFVCFASRAYLNARGTPESYADLARHDCILHSDYVHRAGDWLQRSDALTMVRKNALVINSTAAMASVCRSGGGIALLPSFIGDELPGLIPLNLPAFATLSFWLAYTERARRLARGAVAIEWLRSCFDPERSVWFRETFVPPEADA